MATDLPCAIHGHYFRGAKKTTGGDDGGVQRRNFRDPELGSGGMEGLQRKWVTGPSRSKECHLRIQSESDTLAAFISEKCVENTVAKVHTTKLFQSFKEWAKENNESEQIRSSRAMIGLLRDRGYEVSVGSQNKHYVHGLGLEAEENETWVN